MKVIIIIIGIVVLPLAITLVNKVYQLYMRLIGAETMFYSGKKKIIAMFIVWVVIWSIILNIFGLGKYL